MSIENPTDEELAYAKGVLHGRKQIQHIVLAYLATLTNAITALKTAIEKGI